MRRNVEVENEAESEVNGGDTYSKATLTYDKN